MNRFYTVLTLTVVVALTLATYWANDTSVEPVSITRAPVAPWDAEVADNSNQKKPSVSQPYLPSLDTAANSFSIYRGIKDVLDALILQADSTEPQVILLFANSYCNQQNLSEAACAEFKSLLARYIEYKLALQQLDQQTADLHASSQEIRYQFDRMRAVQRDYFTYEEIDVLFSQDRVYDQAALQRREIARAEDLSDAEKQALIEENLASLPENERIALAPSLNMRSLDKIKADYPDLQQRLIEAENQFGYEAAQRLAKVWQSQAEFESRVVTVAEQYFSINTNNGLSEQQVQSQRAELLLKHFDANEARRARVILIKMVSG